MFQRNLAILAIVTCLASCSLFDRHNQEQSLRGTRSSPKSYQSPDVSKSIRLKQLENSISSKAELDQYSRMLPWFKDNQERIQFLELGDIEARQRWINQAGISGRIKKIEQSFADLLQAQDIAIGMPETLVRTSWGDPTRVDVSGDPRFKNYRWYYDREISTQDGFRREIKTVYLEGGKVMGWDLQ